MQRSFKLLSPFYLEVKILEFRINSECLKMVLQGKYLEVEIIQIELF